MERLIVALDLPDAASALALVDGLGAEVARYKVGLELFISDGANVIRELRARGKRVFLDLKLHDIPETVARAAQVAGKLGVELLTVHAAGGVAMMKRAVEAAAPARVLAVTVLTSLDAHDLAADGQPLTVEELVLRRAELAQQAGCAGVISSPREIAALRKKYDFLIVTPGVRAIGEASGASRGASREAVPGGMPGPETGDDQKRTATAKEARQAGADAVVVGRPIRDATDPLAVVRSLVQDLS